MSVQISVKLSPAVAADLTSDSPSAPESGEILDAARSLGVDLRPMHPGIQDSELASYFKAEAPDGAAAESIATSLRQCPGVEGAYSAPPPELPFPDSEEPT